MDMVWFAALHERVNNYAGFDEFYAIFYNTIKKMGFSGLIEH